MQMPLMEERVDGSREFRVLVSRGTFGALTCTFNRRGRALTDEIPARLFAGLRLSDSAPPERGGQQGTGQNSGRFAGMPTRRGNRSSSDPAFRSTW